MGKAIGKVSCRLSMHRPDGNRVLSPGAQETTMSAERQVEPTAAQVAEMQTALFNLRDGLMRLKMSLLELASMTDEEGQRLAAAEMQALMTRLRA